MLMYMSQTTFLSIIEYFHCRYPDHSQKRKKKPSFPIMIMGWIMIQKRTS